MNIAAVIVCFEPDLSELIKCVESVVDQVDRVFVMDNSESEPDLSVLARCEIVPMNGNKGIAKAQNVGVDLAERSGAQQVLLLDQDSQLMPGAVQILSNALGSHPNCAVVGPRFRELNSGQLSRFVTIPSFSGSKKKVPEPPEGCVHTDFLISSGTLMSVEKRQVIGPMREDFFIDYVDTEWCFRASALGFSLLGVDKELMRHRIGESCFRVWIGGWRFVPINNPIRNFYSFRNGAALVLDSRLSLLNRAYIATRLVAFLLLISCARNAPPRSLTHAIEGLAGSTHL